MRVLITGAAGAIGCHLVRHFIEQTDWTVTCLDSFEHGGDFTRIRVAVGDGDWTRVRTVRHDLNEPVGATPDHQIGDVDHIVHLAALSDVAESVRDPRRSIENNVNATLNMLEWAARREHRTFLHFSTDEVYGDARPGENRMPWDPHRPSNPYSASKAACEDIAHAYWRAGLVNLVITNTTNNFGEMQQATKYPTMVQRLLHRGETVRVHTCDGVPGTRYYLHSKRTAEAVAHILRSEPTRHRLGDIDQPDKYHIAGAEALDNLTMAHLIADLMGVPLEYELVDCLAENPAHDLNYTIQHNGVPGWKPPVTLVPDLDDTIRWHLKHPEWLA